ncbi:hypothetical protein V6N13_138242 [Hibiscus sabdariffa]
MTTVAEAAGSVFDRLERMDFKTCDRQDEEYGDLSYLNLPLKKTQSAYYRRDYDGQLAGNITEVESEIGLSLSGNEGYDQ